MLQGLGARARLLQAATLPCLRYELEEAPGEGSRRRAQLPVEVPVGQQVHVQQPVVIAVGRRCGLTCVAGSQDWGGQAQPASMFTYSSRLPWLQDS